MVVTIVKSKHAYIIKYTNMWCNLLYTPLVLHHTHTHFCIRTIYAFYVNDKTVLRSYINVICC